MSKIYFNIKERILYFAEKEEVSKKVFFKKVGLQYSNFTGKSKESDLSSKALEQILLNYKEINPYWLLTGKGEMLVKQEALHGAAEPPLQYETNNKAQQQLIEALQNTIQAKNEIISLLRSKLNTIDNEGLSKQEAS